MKKGREHLPLFYSILKASFGTSVQLASLFGILPINAVCFSHLLRINDDTSSQPHVFPSSRFYESSGARAPRRSNAHSNRSVKSDSERGARKAPRVQLLPVKYLPMSTWSNPTHSTPRKRRVGRVISASLSRNLELHRRQVVVISMC